MSAETTETTVRPTFRRARIAPVASTWICPANVGADVDDDGGDAGEDDDLDEDDVGDDDVGGGADPAPGGVMVGVSAMVRPGPPGSPRHAP
ncbi:hypothetical protein V6K52_14350 [Knoellia sp. S7-12]|uniref:hypothetical protein n=1 Tax=Knoellia sp. S7-12 TaxID=3126698 RepID=UPI003369505E